MATDPIVDKMLRDMNAARVGKGSPVQLAEDMLTNADVVATEPLDKKPDLAPHVERIAAQTGVTTDLAHQLADEVSRGGQPALVVESYKAENDARDAFKRLYEAEVIRLRRCPLRVRRDGQWEPCGVPLQDLQQALVHHSMHLMYESKDDRVRRAITNDISQKIWPDEIKGVRAALTAEERAALFRDPKMRDRLLKRGVNEGVATDD